MNHNYIHSPVLLGESVEGLDIKPNGIYVDGTGGAGGHSLEICKLLQSGRLIAIDRDEQAINKMSHTLAPFLDKVTIIKDNFKNIPDILQNLSINSIDGCLLDLGVSSHQLDSVYRGFSYANDAALDMRMDQSQTLTAHEILNTYSEKDLSEIIYKFSEERWAGRIAKFIVKYRCEKPINTTFDLVNIIDSAIPKAERLKSGSHPAKKTFMALRIAVNDELGILKNSIEGIVNILSCGGRLVVITFHSLEDRIIKNTFSKMAGRCICPKNLPECGCNAVKQINIITKKPIIPTQKETEANPRARSAKLRIAEKIGETYVK